MGKGNVSAKSDACFHDDFSKIMQEANKNVPVPDAGICGDALTQFLE